jgi:hypothetical protein
MRHFNARAERLAAAVGCLGSGAIRGTRRAA